MGVLMEKLEFAPSRSRDDTLRNLMVILRKVMVEPSIDSTDVLDIYYGVMDSLDQPESVKIKLWETTAISTSV